ncbi:MAG: type 1 periplasmic binding fold superfamily protein, partial [Polaribacter sp.]|nr:type 1 periplasmic binding fold superfamily protein [Polaribacter sp.]
MKTTKFLAILFISALCFTACSEDDDHDDHDHGEHEEEITQLVYTLSNTANSADVVTFTFTDEDGDGGQDGTKNISGNLTANATYEGKLELLNLEEEENVGAEIAEDDAENHEIFYITNVAGLQFTTTDVDANSNLLGFDTDVTTGAEGTGKLTISVVHEGKKPNDGTTQDALSG